MSEETAFRFNWRRMTTSPVAVSAANGNTRALGSTQQQSAEASTLWLVALIEAMNEVGASQSQACESSVLTVFGNRLTLPAKPVCQIQPVDAEMNVSIDESGRNGAIAQIKDVCAAGTADRARDLDDGVAFYQDFRRAEHRVAQAVEQFSANDNCFRHCELPLLELNLLHGTGRPTSFAEGIRR